MVPLTQLWLPILVSSVIVFVAANILWMALPFWHRKDYGVLPNDKAFVEAARPVKSGMYIFPFQDYKKLTPEEFAALKKEPMGYMLIRNPNVFSFPLTIAGYFLYTLLISTLVAYIAGCVMGPGQPYAHVFRIVGAAGMLAWAFGAGHISDSLWYGKPWSVTIKTIIDGILFGLLMGGTFGWLWPK